ncbi:probable protein phosphatase 2C 13 isoform X1 [Populus alba]|uniref:probable protein phosphatase 2C 13 isoform X1 n=2 Tax=Populus alba TaxID=43335 RepID=UPI00158EC26C|nr:probable protein phosphatase 2C 13 isoform X1 [Populus alba]
MKETTEIMCNVIDVQYQLFLAKDQLNMAPSTPVFDSISTEVSRFETGAICSVLNGVIRRLISQGLQVVESSAAKPFPCIRSGSHADIGSRPSMDDEHVRIDDLSAHLGSYFKCPSSFYAVFDGHGGRDAAAYVKRNAVRLFFEDVRLPQTSVVDDVFLGALLNSHREAFLQADSALADKSIASSSCGTTALTALVLGRHLVVANAGDCRAVLCRKGVAVDVSQDHKPSSLPERRRVEELGGRVEGEYLVDVSQDHKPSLSVTRALGDWDFKLRAGSTSPLTAEPEVQQFMLTEADEFLIIGCDGIWDVMSSQHAVSLVRRGLRLHDDPEHSARELVMEASRLHSADNLTAVVVCFASPNPVESCEPQSRRLRCSRLSEAWSKLKSSLEGN